MGYGNLLPGPNHSSLTWIFAKKSSKMKQSYTLRSRTAGGQSDSQQSMKSRGNKRDKLK